MMRLFSPRFVLIWATGFAVSEAFAAENDWTFFDEVAVKLPAGWRTISQNKQPGLGTEIVLGRSDDNYARLFISGDKMSDAEFRKSMEQAIQEKKADASAKIIGEPKIVPYLEGLRMDLRFERTLKNKAYFEIHAPMVAKGRGMDIFFVAPRASYDNSSKEFESLLANLRPFWLPTHIKNNGMHGKTQAKPQD